MRFSFDSIAVHRAADVVAVNECHLTDSNDSRKMRAHTNDGCMRVSVYVCVTCNLAHFMAAKYGSKIGKCQFLLFRTRLIVVRGLRSNHLCRFRDASHSLVPTMTSHRKIHTTHTRNRGRVRAGRSHARNISIETKLEISAPQQIVELMMRRISLCVCVRSS